MNILKCKMCGGDISFDLGESVGTCEFCGTKQTLPRLDSDVKKNLYDRANHFRRNNEYDKAISIYEQILSKDTTDSEAYWSLVLCNYGIEYVEDPSSHKRVPTVNRAQFTSIFDDENYKAALKYSDNLQKSIYEDEARTINEIQKGILSISQKEEPFDVFICYKETDSEGNRTPDSVLAYDLYNQLIQEGLKVFFARVTLEDKLGIAYEPYIFAALNSAKVMIVLGTKKECFEAVWVKNEWSRYLTLVKKSQGKKILVPAFKDMDPYDLPEEFSHLQAQDMSRLGFAQDLIRGIKKIIEYDDNREKQDRKNEQIGDSSISNSVNIDTLLKRVYIYLEDCDWDKADELCERILDVDPENALAYLGKLLASHKIPKKERILEIRKPLDNDTNYKKVVRFGDENLSNEVKKYNSIISANCQNANGIKKRAEEIVDFLRLYRDYSLIRQNIEEYENQKKELEEELDSKIWLFQSDKKQLTRIAIMNMENAIIDEKEKLANLLGNINDIDEKKASITLEIQNNQELYNAIMQIDRSLDKIELLKIIKYKNVQKEKKRKFVNESNNIWKVKG